MTGNLQTLFAAVQDGYYRFDPLTWESGFGPVQVVSKMGLPQWADRDYGAELLAQVELAVGARVAVVGCGNGLIPVAAALAVEDGQVLAADTSWLAARAAIIAGELNGLSNLTVSHSDGLESLGQEPFDAILAQLPKGRQIATALIGDAFFRLTVGGELFLAGANRGGIKTAATLMKQAFGNVRTFQVRKGHRLLVATKQTDRSKGPLPSSAYYDEHFLSVGVVDGPLTLSTRPGIFGWDKLDVGSEALLAAMEVHDGERVLDLGCGYGILAIAAAQQADLHSLYAVDDHWAAVSVTQANFQRYGIENGTALAGDVIDPVRELAFDVVLANPPFHAGIDPDFAIPLAFLDGSAQVLRPGGRLYLVANQFLKYEPVLHQLFSKVTTVHSDSRFKVLKAVK